MPQSYRSGRHSRGSCSLVKILRTSTASVRWTSLTSATLTTESPVPNGGRAHHRVECTKYPGAMIPTSSHAARSFARSFVAIPAPVCSPYSFDPFSFDPSSFDPSSFDPSFDPAPTARYRASRSSGVRCTPRRDSSARSALGGSLTSRISRNATNVGAGRSSAFASRAHPSPTSSSTGVWASAGQFVSTETMTLRDESLAPALEPVGAGRTCHERYGNIATLDCTNANRSRTIVEKLRRRVSASTTSTSTSETPSSVHVWFNSSHHATLGRGSTSARFAGMACEIRTAGVAAVDASSSSSSSGRGMG
mmetsp:Transcript_10275/g.40153  ORF Transcript_10275/g.40153 Transcript_10275/m.40153 type:complete len:307 (-) Transcript_10275:480-1400(-)